MSTLKPMTKKELEELKQYKDDAEKELATARATATTNFKNMFDDENNENSNPNQNSNPNSNQIKIPKPALLELFKPKRDNIEIEKGSIINLTNQIKNVTKKLESIQQNKYTINNAEKKELEEMINEARSILDSTKTNPRGGKTKKGKKGKGKKSKKAK